jgi:UvrD-like helicase family protein
MPSSAAYSFAVSPLSVQRSTRFAQVSRVARSISASGPQNYATGRRPSGTRFVERIHIGRIRAIDPVEQEVKVQLDGRAVGFDYSDLDELVLAYACSIHKSQGSEYPCVVIPVHTQRYVMLQRNLRYTAITRGKRSWGTRGEVLRRAQRPQRREVPARARVPARMTLGG